ncbi:WD40-repeat-containing domain protein [Tylopilus felleus]
MSSSTTPNTCSTPATYPLLLSGPAASPPPPEHVHITRKTKYNWCIAIPASSVAGVIRKGGIESRLDRTLSHSSAHPDRFITTREDAALPSSLSSGATAAAANASTSSPGHTARLANATGVPLNKRVLVYHEPPPASSSPPLPNASSTHQACTYLWTADTGVVSHLGDAPDETYVASVDFSGDGAYIGIGLGTGSIELWDVATSQKLRTMAPSSDATSAGQVASLSWFNHILTSGHSNGSIVHHDVRVPRHVIATLQGHTGEVCGLPWSPGGEVLVSGGNDNVVNLWNVASGTRGAPEWTKRNHTAAVKALAFSPWSPLLASGGGTSDTLNGLFGARHDHDLHMIFLALYPMERSW